MLSKNEIRLLDLLPVSSSDSSSVVRCRTRIIPLSLDCPYETLSYVWGDQGDRTEISVDGNVVTVTSSLESALKQIRLTDSIRVIWVDQLCIDQDDELEKGNQVPLMGHIYSRTTQCLIWLGQIPQDISLSEAKSALHFIRLLSEGKQSDDTQLSTLLELDSDGSLSGPIKAFQSICYPKNPWWTRTWTLQESILPPRACIQWGQLSMPWETLESAASNLVSLPHSSVLDPYLAIINELPSHVIGLRISKESSLGHIDFVFRWRLRRATKTLDKVYGLLGLFPPEKLPRSRACDYRLSPAQVFATFTVDLIESYRDLHALALQYMQTHPSSTDNLPSWALDMQDETDQDLRIDGMYCSWYLMHTYNCYNAGGATIVDPDDISYDRASGTLSLPGFKVDDIAVAVSVSKPSEDKPGTSNITCDRLAQLVREWYQVAEDFYRCHPWQVPQNGPRTWSEAFWRSLVGNIRVDGEFYPEGEATSEDIEMAKEFVKTGNEPICYSLFGNIAYKKLIITTTGMLGFGPHHSEVGDQVWILHGGKMPFVLRRVTEGMCSANDFYFVGSSYVDGIMHGEAESLGKPVCTAALR
ncbi:heterokaryon incompatibility protein-domain-containing protein [Nemania sp. NC0429]|nr:heterokaryon incompatibility protein-domain-containing protein [Nemania sp. NC0429]